MAKLNKVTYEDGVFISKTGRDLSKNLPKHLFWVIVLMMPFTIQSVFFIKSHIPFLHEKMFAYTAAALFVPTMYFILKNCPISILFNKKALVPEVIGIEGGSYNHSHSGSNSKHFTPPSGTYSNSSMSNPRNLYSNPSYRSYSGNIFKR